MQNIDNEKSIFISSNYKPRYVSKEMNDTLKPFDGKFLVRTPEKLVKEGEETTLTVVIEFPNKDKALGWYNSDEHQKIVVATGQL